MKTRIFRINYEDGPAEMESLLKALVKFFGGDWFDVTPHEEGLTWVEYEVMPHLPEEMAKP